MPDDRLIVALDVQNIIAGLELVRQLDTAVSFYKIGLGMLTSGGLALANELKGEYDKRIFLDLKLFDISATIEAAVKGISKFDVDFLTVHGDPSVVTAAKNGAAGSNLKILAVTILTSLDRKDLDASMIKNGDIKDLVSERASRAFEAGADGVIASPQECIRIRDLPNSKNNIAHITLSSGDVVEQLLEKSYENKNVKLIIRHDDLILSFDKNDTNLISGKLSYKAYMGNFLQIEIDLNDGSKIMANISDQLEKLVSMELGSEISLQMISNKALVFDEEDNRIY